MPESPFPMPDAFFAQLGPERFQPTEWSIGPWGRDSLHAGPPAALLGRAIERATEGLQVARVTFDILRPIPLEPFDVDVEIVRPGGKIRLVKATLATAAGPVMLATAWAMRTAALDLDTPPRRRSFAGPSESNSALDEPGDRDYLHAMEWRFARGTFFEVGPATAWLRMRYPLLEGEDPSPLTRVLVAADSGNGISAAVDFFSWIFVNTDLTIHLHRLPEGEWVCLDAETVIEPHGGGLAVSSLFDEHGEIGRGLQTLYVAPRV